MHNTQVLEVGALLVTITGKMYVGLQRNNYYQDKNNSRLKSNFLPSEASTTFVTQAITTLDKAIREEQAKETPARTETTNSQKRPYSNGFLTLTFLNGKIFRILHTHHIPL